MSAPFPDESRLPPPYVHPHQAQARPPSAYENLLGDALEAAFRDGARQLEDVVARLNADGVRTPTGGTWTSENFESILKGLG
jgi:hypothetical protein